MRYLSLMIFGAILASTVSAAEYPDMVGLWSGDVRTVSSGEQVRNQVARGGGLIEQVKLRFSVDFQDGEVFMGTSKSDAPGAEPTPVWGAIRSTGTQAVFVTSNGGRGQIWFQSATEFEYCFANQTQEAMSAHCAVLEKE